MNPEFKKWLQGQKYYNISFKSGIWRVLYVIPSKFWKQYYW
jgi:hypothetical protein